ncbi:hypothetical protein N431DRAFT_231396 [Stipitochalara longipes BDJ]|nr:hypothetical protein N431DRAFT_231396 [Stipitochalara longipes BDJ]
MADPLNSISTILGSCDAILRTILAGAQYVSAVKEAQNDFKRIQFEIQNLQAITAALGEFLKSQKVKNHGFHDTAPIAKAIQDCKLYVTKLQEDFTAASRRSHLLWPLSGKKGIQQTLQDLDRFTNLFHWALSVNGWSFFCESMEKTTKTLEQSLESYQNMVQLLKPFPQMQSDIQDINDHCQVIQAVLEVFQSDTIPKCSTDVSNILVKVADIKREMQTKVDNKEREELLEWVSGEDYLHKQRDVSGARQDGTSTWVFEADVFRKWAVSNEFETFWCHGIPGSGKTVIFGAVVDWLFDRRSATNSIVAVIYFDYKEQSFYKHDAIFLSILRQFCSQSYSFPTVVKALKDLRERCLKERDRRPVLGDCEDLLNKIREAHEKRFVCCDGLDELPDSYRLGLMKSLVNLNERYKIRILLTSRDHIELSPCPGRLVKCHISATFSNLRAYLEAKIDAAELSCLSRKAHRSSALRTDIITTICSKAKGMFLLAELHIKQLESAITEREIRELLRVLPDAIDDHYESYIERIKTHRQGTRALEALLWIFCAYRPLSPEELLEALSIQDGDEDLDDSGMMTIDTVLNITGGLLSLERESNTITLNALQRSHKLFKYAFLFWGDHIRDAGQQASAIGIDIATRIASSVILLRFVSQTGIFHLPLLDPEGFIPLHVAVLWKSEIIVENLLGQLSGAKLNALVNHASNAGLTPLHIATMTKSIDILKTLYSNGADLRLEDMNSRTATFFATACSNFEALHFLTTTKLPEGEKKLLVNVADKIRIAPLHLALQNADEDCVRELLLAGADVEATTATGQTPLHYAVRYAPQMTDLLLKYNVPVHATSENGHNALHWACTRGDSHSIEVLLAQGCSPNQKSASGECPLHL